MDIPNQRGVIIAVAFLTVAGLVGASATGTLLISGTDVTENNDGIVISASNGPQVNVAGDLTVYNNTGGGNNSIDWYSSAGNITFRSAGPANVTVQKSNITGTWTHAESLDVAQNELYINPEDKPAINVSGNANRIAFRSPSLDDGAVDFEYAGPSGTTTVTVRSLPSNQAVRAIDADTGEVLDVAMTDGNGVATLENMTNSEHRVTLQSGDAKPVLDDPRPDGNVSTAPDTFSVHVSDNDFTGDNVTLEWYYEGGKINETYATSDGRYNVSAPNISSGVHDWSVVATDENGNRDIENATVGLPGTLYIRNETNASELVDDPINVTVSFDNGTTIERITTSDGTIDMTGLETTDFIVEIEASENYYSRTVKFQSIVGDSSVYVLNRSYAAVESRFTLDDPTGQFPSDSIVIVKKGINQSGEVRYRTIHSDEFGTEGVTVDLEKNERYQISVRSPDDVVQSVGPYRADVNETVTIQPGSPSIGVGDISDGWTANAEVNNRTLEVRYTDPEELTQSVTIYIHEKGNESNQLRPNETYFDLGNFSATYQLTENESEKTWVVKFDTERDGQDYTLVRQVENNPDLTPDLSREWRLIVGVGILLISAGVFSLLNAGVGGVVVALEGGMLWWTGWLSGATTAMAVAIALFVAVINHIYRSGP